MTVHASSLLLLCSFSAFVALFTLPKVYESNKAQIDQNLDIVRSKIADITSK
jgi:Reticulon.